MLPIEEAFAKGDVYLNYSFEDVKFRYENKTGRVFRRFHGQPEVEASYTSNLFRDAMSSGTLITREEYYQD